MDFATRWVEVDSKLLELVMLAKMTEWLHGQVPVFPIVSPQGAVDTGKTRLGDVLWVLSFRGMRVDGVLSLSSLFRNAEKWKGTLYINEGDIDEGRRSEDSEANQLLKYLRSRYEKCAAVWRTNKQTLEPEVFDSFGPTILVARKSFQDEALESRCLVVPMSGRTRTEIPLNLPPEFYSEAECLRNKLELFRLRNLLRFENDYKLEFPGISTRMNQILQPMASLAKVYLPQLYELIASLAGELAERVVEVQANSDEGLIVRAYLAADPTLEGISAGEISQSLKDLHKVEMAPQQIGRRARSLGFVASQIGRGAEKRRLLKLEPAQAIRMLDKYVPADEREEYLPQIAKRSQKPIEGFGATDDTGGTVQPSTTAPVGPSEDSSNGGSTGPGTANNTRSEEQQPSRLSDQARVKLQRLRQIFRPELVKWALARKTEALRTGDTWGPYQLRQEAKGAFPELEHEPALLADQHFQDLEEIAKTLKSPLGGPDRSDGMATAPQISLSPAEKLELLERTFTREDKAGHGLLEDTLDELWGDRWPDWRKDLEELGKQRVVIRVPAEEGKYRWKLVKEGSRS
jgi:hypothetical protein